MRLAPPVPVLVLVVAAALTSSVASAQGEAGRTPRIAIGVNVAQTAIYGIASSFFESSLFVPVPIEGHFRLSRRWGLAATLQYLHHKDGTLKLNGLSVSLGPRFTLWGEGLRGLYAAVKLGIGFRHGDDYFRAKYYRVGMQIQPELGWSFAWGPPGFFLSAGVGLQSEVTLTEESHSGWAWNGLGAMINYYLPMVNVTVGFDL